MAKDPIWLEDQLVGVKKGPLLAAELNKIPVVGQVAETVNTVVGLIPASTTTTVETTLDAAALAEIRTIALGTLNWFNTKWQAAGLPPQDISEMDADLAAYLKTQTGGELDLTSQFPESGATTTAAAHVESAVANNEPAAAGSGASGSSDAGSGDDNAAMHLNDGATANPAFD